MPAKSPSFPIPLARPLPSPIGSASLLAIGLGTSFAEDPVPPPPPSTGTDIPQTYFGPPASDSFSENNESLVGPVQLLKSGTVDQRANTTTIPLYLGHDENGKNVWFILTDTTDQDNADALGLNFSAKLAYANVGRAVRTATLQKDASLVFENGAVDFRPARVVVPGRAPNAFPPRVGRPGSVGDANYTPYVQIVNAPGSPIYNAPVVAYDVSAEQLDFCEEDDGPVDYRLVHDRVVNICPEAESNGAGTVTLQMTTIFSFAKPSSYISMEASDAVTAALDNATFAPAIGDLPVGRDDSAFSPIERLFPIANGPTGKDNPQRQGLNSAVLGEGDPLHVIGGLPTVSNDYSPAWDLNLGYWTQEAIDKGYRARVIDEFQYLDLVRGGFITGPDGAPFGSTGIVVNCPIVIRFL
ncbi:MAG: hypothetical protein WKF47_10720 [Geodermatophilaceae bacterium]